MDDYSIDPAEDISLDIERELDIEKELELCGKLCSTKKKGILRTKKEPGAKRESGGTKESSKRKRGPPRPHRKLQDDVLALRITKLQKRIDRAQGQLEDATRHIDGYNKENELRMSEKEEQ
jgi:hypothetical protein